MPQSKIIGQLRSVAEAPYRIAPERVEDLKQIVDRFGISFKVDGATNGFDFSASWMIGRIFSTLRSLEYLWANAYFNIVLYDAYVAAPRGVVVEIDGFPERERARDLLLWADEALHGHNTAWPDNLPSPETPPDEDVYIEKANYLFFTMCGFVLLHEIAHIVNEHRVEQETPYDVRQEYEYDADKWAYDWILANWRGFSEDPRVFTVRTLGIASGLVSLAFLELRLPAGDREHPSLPKRLRRFCQEYFPNADGADIASASLSLIPLVLHAHMYRSGIALDSAAQYSTVFDYLDEVDKYFPQ
jgi:hypothetical protein